jgi:hypothetical protein
MVRAGQRPRQSEGTRSMATHGERRTIDGITRRSVLRGGLLAGAGVAAVGGASWALTGVAEAASPQSGWSWCVNCSGMWFTYNNTGGVCPNGIAPHNKVGSYIYEIYNNQSNIPNTQGNWAWCELCQGLFYNPNVNDSHCPAHILPTGGTGNHVGIGEDGSYNYYLQRNVTIVADPQSYWRWCGKCQGLYHQGSSGSSKGVCPYYYPSFSTPHQEGGGSFNYAVPWSGTYT